MMRQFAAFFLLSFKIALSFYQSTSRFIILNKAEAFNYIMIKALSSKIDIHEIGLLMKISHKGIFQKHKQGLTSKLYELKIKQYEIDQVDIYKIKRDKKNSHL